jgi:hypothetical protein
MTDEETGRTYDPAEGLRVPIDTMAREMLRHFATFGPPPNDGARRLCKPTKVNEETGALQVLARCASHGESVRNKWLVSVA